MAESAAARVAGCVGGAAVILAAVIISGLPRLDAPFIQGDEQIFIAGNPDVTAPAGAGLGRWLGIFTHAHEDLYQPLTILTYAIEWHAWGERRIAMMRLSDVLLHAANALLLWHVVAVLLRRLAGAAAAAAITVGWIVAVAWAQHPMLVNAWAADMGRTHLLSATFMLLALRLHLAALAEEGHATPSQPAARARQRAAGWFAASALMLLLAMLNKPVVGYVLIAAALEAALRGWRRTLVSARVAVLALMCGFFAWLTLWTTRSSLLLEDSPLPLFGDPLSRALTGLSLYLTNALLPGTWLSAWYPPDIHTGWSSAGTLGGAAAAVALLLLGGWAALQPRWRLAALGAAWFFATWLPISGIVGARVAAGQDRYMYLPLAGLLLIVANALVAAGGAWPRPARLRLTLAAALAGALGLLAIAVNTSLAAAWRTTLGRATRAWELNPDDPRVAEMLAAAYAFARDHGDVAFDATPHDHLRSQEAALHRAAELAQSSTQYWPDTYHRAAFHRRLSFEFWKLGLLSQRLGEAELATQRLEASLDQARRAADLQPAHRLTRLRLAHGLRALGRTDEARAVYEELLPSLPADAPDRTERYVEYGSLLLRAYGDARGALLAYREAVRASPPTGEARRAAVLGLARCEVLVGSGEVGIQLVRNWLRSNPGDIEALLVAGMFHARSHEFEEAADAYGAILERDPGHYEALRGYAEVCGQVGYWDGAVAAWGIALGRDPENVVLQSHLTWALACAADELAPQAAAALLSDQGESRFARLALALVATREGHLGDAVTEADRAVAAPEVSVEARELDRAEAVVRLMLERGELPPEAVLLRARLVEALGAPELAAELAGAFLRDHPETPWAELARRWVRPTP